MGDADADSHFEDGSQHSQIGDANAIIDDAASEEVPSNQLASDFFYSDDDPELQPMPEAGALPSEAAKPMRFVGFDHTRPYNLLWTSADEFAYVTGHAICIVNLLTGDRREILGRDSGGIGAIAMDPDMVHLAVAEKSTTSMQPNVYVYAYKKMRLYRILRKGTTHGYASVQFSHHNEAHMATLGMAPDYMLSVWDWRNERLLLKCKAYGQDVFSIRWGQFPGMLVSVGVGHIRFWKMAATFTGLKLQGDLGKFGATELSDIVGFVELPDGKVVTGSEYGKLLLWEGVFVKVELTRTAADTGVMEPMHAGAIDVAFLLEEENSVVSGGDDGYLRWWSVAEIDEAEADYDKGILEYGITMQQEVRIPMIGDISGVKSPAHIKHVARSKDGRVWLIQDVRNGVVWKYMTDSKTCISVIKSHAGPVTGTVVMQNFPGLVLSSGIDGTLRAYNMSKERDQEMFCDRRSTGITCLVAAPAIVDPEMRTVCCGYTDGTIRLLSLCGNSFILMQALKPHTSPVRQLAYSPEGSFLASLGTDNTIFVFELRSLDDQALPLGFVQLPCQVNSLSWHREQGKMLVALQDGHVLELEKPVVDEIDNTESFHFELPCRLVKPVIPEPEEPEVEGEDGEGEGEEGGVPTEVNGNKHESKDADDEQDGAQEEVESTITHAVYCYTGPPHTEILLFAGTGEYSGGLWEMSIQELPTTPPSETPLAECIPTSAECTKRADLPPGVLVTHMSMSPNERFLFVGFEDGHMWAIPLNNMALHSAIGLADSTNGRICAVDAEGEENMLVLGGADGSLSMVMFNGEAIVELAEQQKSAQLEQEQLVESLGESMPDLPEMDPEDWEIPDAEGAGARDITDEKHYSIQDQKLKAEEDNARAQAEQKKRRVRDRILEIREELEDLMGKNADMPCNKLSDIELTVDQEYVKHLTENMDVKIEEVRFELAWTCEKHERGLQKLKDYFLGKLDFERIEVRGFRSPHRVTTFRCPSMSQELQDSLARLHELIFAANKDSDGEEGGSGDAQKTLGTGKTSTQAGERGEGAEATGSDAGDAAPGTVHSMTKGAEQRELRRQQRIQRKQEMMELEKTKPSDTYEDPRDLEAIAHAEATLGNYMLKTSESYQVPESQRMNAEKKRRQMYLLEESMHAIRTEFNQRVLALREFRQQVRKEVERDLSALHEIDQQLGTHTPWVIGILEDEIGAPPEYPETRFNYSEPEVKSFEKQLQGTTGSRSASPITDTDEGDGLIAQAASAAPAFSSPLEATQVPWRSALASRRITWLSLRAQILHEKAEAAGDIGQAVVQEALARLRYDKDQLEEHVRQILNTFNDAVGSIEKEKAKLESDLKNADMKLLVLYEELLMLNELESKDAALVKKATKCRQDKTSIMHQIKECQDQLGERKAEIDQWHSEEQSLQAEFTELVGENSPFLQSLLKIYKKKVKRSKRKKLGAGDDDDFASDDDEDEEDSDGDSDEDDDELDDEVGPPLGCDVQIYDGVIELREKRLEMEDALQEIHKAVEELRKTHKKLMDEEKRIDNDQRATDKEIQSFQTDKQRKLNQVPIVFALRLSQVQCLGSEPGCLPEELEEQVIFTREGLNRVMSRITELHREKAEVKSSHKQLQKEFRVRKKEKNAKIQNMEELQAKFEDIQMLKFGQVVDLDLIERSAPNKYVQELQEKVGDAEVEHRRMISEWEKRTDKMKKELAKVTGENTSLMEQIVSMGSAQMELDSALNARIANVTVNDTEPLVEQREMEQQRLKEQLAMQSREIGALQAEIALFRKKGGHIYTTVTANRPTDRR